MSLCAAQSRDLWCVVRSAQGVLSEFHGCLRYLRAEPPHQVTEANELRERTFSACSEAEAAEKERVEDLERRRDRPPAGAECHGACLKAGEHVCDSLRAYKFGD